MRRKSRSGRLTMLIRVRRALASRDARSRRRSVASSHNSAAAVRWVSVPLRQPQLLSGAVVGNRQ